MARTQMATWKTQMTKPDGYVATRTRIQQTTAVTGNHKEVILNSETEDITRKKNIVLQTSLHTEGNDYHPYLDSKPLSKAGLN